MFYNMNFIDNNLKFYLLKQIEFLRIKEYYLFLLEIIKILCIENVQKLQKIFTILMVFKFDFLPRYKIF